MSSDGEMFEMSPYRVIIQKESCDIVKGNANEYLEIYTEKRDEFPIFNVEICISNGFQRDRSERISSALI
jgi:hypothetical protein